MSNSVNLSLDVTKNGIQNPLIKVRQGDGGFETLHTTVTSNGEPLDLQGWTITFMGTTAGNHNVIDANVKVVEAPNGIFDYTPSKAWGMDIGDFKIAYFKFVKGDGTASSANFRVSVIEAVDLTQEEAQNYISIVDTTIAEINQHLTDSLANITQSIADANNNANSVSSNVTALGKQVDEYNNKLAAIKVGGRNLMLGTADFSGGSSRWTALATVTTDRYRGILISSSSAGYGRPSYTIQNAGILQVGKTYTFSIYARNTSDTDAIVARDYNANIVTPASYEIKLPAHTDWTRVSSTFTVKNDPTTSTDGLRWNTHNSVTNGTVQFAGYKLEEGNVATDWTPAPEDTPSNDAQLVHKTGTETIAGDKTFTSPIIGRFKKYDIKDGYDLNGYQSEDTFLINGANNLVNYPANASKLATLVVHEISNSTATQTLIDTNNDIYTRTMGGNPPTWSSWFKVAKSSEVVHNTGNETIAGDKTFTGNTSFTGDFTPKTFTDTGAGNGITWTAYRTGKNVFLTIQGTTAALTSAGSFMSGFRVNEGMRPVNTATNSIRIGSVSTSTGALRSDGTITFNTDIPASVIVSGSFSYFIS